jgi:hypothetical protein
MAKSDKKSAKSDKKSAKNPAIGVNRKLDKMVSLIEKAKTSDAKSVVVFTTDKKSYNLDKESNIPNGFGASDLKPKLYAAYKHLLCNYDVKTRPINVNNYEIEWFVNLK